MDKEKNYANESENNIDFEELAKLFISHWRWFVLSIVTIVTMAIYYLVSTTPTYTRSETIGFKDINDKSNSLNLGISNSALSDLGVVQPTTNIYDEIITLKAIKLMESVALRLNLQNQIFIKKGLQTILLYKTAPISVSYKELLDNQSGSFKTIIKKNGKIELSNFRFNDESYKDFTIVTTFNKEIKTPIGHIVINKTPFYDNMIEGTPLFVKKSSIKSISGTFNTQFTASLVNKESSMLSLSITDPSTQRAEDILKTIVDVYNENWVKQKNAVAVNTSQFIKERLKTIETELKSVDQIISDFKSKHLIPNVEAVSTAYLTQSTENTKKIFELNNELSVAKFLKNYLNDETKENKTLPANIGLSQSGIDSQINKYNEILLKRNNLIDNSGKINPMVKELNLTLAGYKSSILQSIENTISILDKQINDNKEKETETNEQIASSPEQAKQLLSVERQQKVKEALYIFLLQKGEENELSKAYTVPNSMIVQPPIGPLVPSTPKKKQILLIAFILGVLIPGVILFLRENFNTTIRGSKDLENIDIPYLGDIPLYETEEIKKRKQNKIMSLLRGQKKVHFGNLLVVEPNNNNAINESFRIVRTKLDFTLSQLQNKVVLVTSFNPGSGKTFITQNIATCMSFMKKTIIIDLDLRHSSLSKYYSKNKKEKGISSYLNGDIDDYKEIVIHDEKRPNLDIIVVGINPPNPSELLTSKRLKTLIDQLKEDGYEYIFIDTPPIKLVADTEIIQHYVDLSLFVIRTNVLDRRALPEISEIEKESEHKLSILLNGSKYSSSYGYRSYHYGNYRNYDSYGTYGVYSKK